MSEKDDALKAGLDQVFNAYIEEPQPDEGEEDQEKAPEEKEEKDVEDSPEEGQEEGVEEGEEEGSEEEGEEEPEEEEPEEKDEEVEKLQQVANNLKAALKEERERRKELAQAVEENKRQLEIVSLLADRATEALEKAKERIKELGLEDEISLDVPKLDERELKELRERAEKEQAQAVQRLLAEIKSVTAEKLPDFKNIDPASEAQGRLLGSAVIGLVAGGLPVEDAVSRAMSALDAMIGKVKASSAPKPKPKPKPKASRVRRGEAAQARQAAVAAETGDYSGYFLDIAKQLAEGG